MAIKNFKENESISVYDPSVGAYHEVPIAGLEKQMASLGLTDSEIKAKIKKLQEGNK